MTASLERTGHCLCGAVRFTATLNKPEVGACHCAMCRRWASAPFMAIDCADLSFEDEDHVRRFRSSDWAERGFCDRCGSALFYHIIGGDNYQMAAGLLDDQTGLAFTHQVFIDKKPDHYAFAQETSNLTEAQIYDMYAPPGTEPIPDETK
ncbi:MAG: GFA family protein [Phyllobacteriaceae bacterium]|jgi:hypothetical protein|nr:GFA family protein [Phyllobacteriaceae bacterium]